MIQITDYLNPELNHIYTVDGYIPWGEWVERETKRINLDPLRTAEIKRKGHNNSLWAIFVNAAPNCTCDQCLKERNKGPDG